MKTNPLVGGIAPCRARYHPCGVVGVEGEIAAVRSGNIDRTEPYGSRNPAILENRFSELRCKVTYVRRPDDEVMLCNRKQSSGVENSITTSPGGQSVQNR